MYIDSTYTDDVWVQIAQGSAEEVDRAVHSAHKAMPEGGSTPSAR